MLQGTTRADQGRRLHRRQRNPARRRGARPRRRSASSARRAARSIPASSGGLGALLNSAPELIDRIQRLTERLTELLSDKNQNAIADILENIDAHHQGAGRPRARPGRRDRAMRGSRRATPASPRSNVAALADSTNRLVNEQGKPAAEDLRKAIASVQQAADNLDAMITDARPGRAEFQQVDAARGQPAGPRPARAVAVAARRSPTASTSRGSAARSGPRNCPTTSQGNANEAAAANSSRRSRWRWRSAAARSAACSAAAASRRRRC